jgi:glutathione synthase/RimK-type ligase-like ATP-grasp enzyme
MEPQPLILAGDKDPHVEAVMSRLASKGVAPKHINKSNLTESGFTLSPTANTITCENLLGITSVWYRRLLPLILPDDMQDKWRKWCEQEFTQALLGALLRLNVYWVSDPFNIKKASLKALQLQVARVIGKFQVPDYIITSNPDVAKSFVVNTCNKQAVIKCLGRPVVFEKTSVSTFFTNKIDNTEHEEWSRLKYAPCIFQRLVKKVTEIRVTVVGRQVFAAAIEINDSIEDVDYRKVDPYTFKHRAIKLPDPIRRGCLAICRYYGLRFAAFDLILDREGNYYFLEINPNGQWLWIEELTGMPISMAIADELCQIPKI